MKSLVTLCVVSLATLAITGQAAHADVNVFVGYADNVHGSPFFPSPWQGDPNVLFEGSNSPWDAGAFRFDNTGSGDITLSDVSVDHFNNGATFTLWGGDLPLVIHPGQIAIFTQTTQYDFDTSDQPILAPPGSSDEPEIHVTLDGTPETFSDSGQVLNTGGFDLANFPTPGIPSGNEALQWRLIGTTGIENPGGTPIVPEPGSLSLLASGALGLLGGGRRRRLIG